MKCTVLWNVIPFKKSEYIKSLPLYVNKVLQLTLTLFLSWFYSWFSLIWFCLLTSSPKRYFLKLPGSDTYLKLKNHASRVSSKIPTTYIILRKWKMIFKKSYTLTQASKMPMFLTSKFSSEHCYQHRNCYTAWGYHIIKACWKIEALFISELLKKSIFCWTFFSSSDKYSTFPSL